MLIQSLKNPDLYPHPIERFEVIETHISWVLLTGRYAYKIKKPVNLGFADFSTIEKRRFYCFEELRLNRRLAPQLYLEVVAIAGSEDSPALNGPGPPIEYAVKMEQFSQENQLDRVIERGRLRREDVDEIARVIAGFHERIDQAGEGTEFGSIEKLHQRVMDNFFQLRKFIPNPARLRRLERLATQAEESHAALHDKFAERLAGGFVRECHGDLHLGNMAFFEKEIAIFDCIEFNPSFRWNDVIDEVAFLVMDLIAHKKPELAFRFLNSYLEHTGDYAGVAMLPYYIVYRAMVRAKVSCIRLEQGGLVHREKRKLLRKFTGYLRLAERSSNPGHPSLTITHGLAGSGKTTATQAILEDQGAIRIRSDIERKRLFGLRPLESSASAFDSGIYSEAASRRTYDRLAELCGVGLQAGYPIIADAAFLRWQDREKFRVLARRLNVPFRILRFEAPEKILRQRIANRSGDASEADIEVLERQIRTVEPLRDSELQEVVEATPERARKGGLPMEVKIPTEGENSASG